MCFFPFSMYGFPHSGNNTSGGEGMKDKLLIFLRKNGFLLFLFICVCVVAVGTIIITTRELTTTEKNNLEDLVILDDRSLDDIVNPVGEDKQVSLDISLEEESSEAKKEDGDTPIEEKNENTDELETEETINEDLADLEFVEDGEEEYEDEDESNFVADKPILDILPIDGELLTEHSFDSLIYSKTLEEWRSHLGIDIKASEGTKIKAPLDGTIKEVYKDDLWGMVVVIDHGQGLETKYANLGTLEMVKPGIRVNKGDYIGTVGKSANIEMMMDSHLHYEAIKNGKIIDPRSINK